LMTLSIHTKPGYAMDMSINHNGLGMPPSQKTSAGLH